MAQVPLKLILEVALERTLAFKSLALSEEAAQTAVIGTRERNPPTLQTSFGYSNSASLSSASGGSESSVNTISTTFSKKLDNGMSYGFTLSERNTQNTKLVAEDWSSVESTTSSDPYSQSSLSANLKVPFFKDSGFEVNNLQVKLAEIGVERAYWNSRSSKLGLLQGIASIYWDLVSIYQSIELQKKSVIISQQLLRDNQARQRAGQLSPTEVLASETQLLRDEQTLYSLRQDALKVEDQVRAALNLPVLPVGLYPSDIPSMHSEDLKESEKLLEEVYENDSQIALNRASLKQKSFEIQQLENNLNTNLNP
jgi:Outer membrane protein